MTPPRLAVFVSGRGSNMEAVWRAIDSGQLKAEMAIVISDREKAPALEKAMAYGIQAVYIPYDKHNRRHFEEQAAELIRTAECDLVILAGFMRILSKFFIDQFEHRIINIHPSLLPSFKGIDAQGQALAYGVKITGCTAHVVTEEMDAGPIIAQTPVQILPEDTEEALSQRILEEEHRLFPLAIAQYAAQIEAEKPWG